MEWSRLYSPKRTGSSLNMDSQELRTAYQRDFDRLIFSSAFRRLQDKTQVFPLPGSTLVHNRLTHSLEVASVGRSLGALVGQYLVESEKSSFNDDDVYFYNTDLSNIIAAACLAHDIGNPAFGHSGEDAISNYFTKESNSQINGTPLRDFFEDDEWSDLISFEGNANALRVLAQDFKGKIKGGLGLTYTTLASIFKYPCGSQQVNRNKIHTKKYSYFKSEKDIFNEVVKELNFEIDDDNPKVFKRHPFVYLVEASDDICYRIIDMEDAHRLKIIPMNTIRDYFWRIIEELDAATASGMHAKFKLLTDDNAAITYLRAKCIGAMIKKSFEIFKEYKTDIIDCNFDSTLMKELEKISPTLKVVEKISIEKIYQHNTVLEIELAGYNVMLDLLSLFVPAVLKSEPSAYEKQVLKLIPNQFNTFDQEITPYQKVMSVLDHVSAMTDIYATDLYRKIKGIEIPRHA